LHVDKCSIDFFRFLVDKSKHSLAKSDDLTSSDDEAVDVSKNVNEKDEIWKVTDVYETSSSEDGGDDDDDSQERSRQHRIRSR
jgi:hypothetical protein